MIVSYTGELWRACCSLQRYSIDVKICLETIAKIWKKCLFPQAFRFNGNRIIRLSTDTRLSIIPRHEKFFLSAFVNLVWLWRRRYCSRWADLRVVIFHTALPVPPLSPLPKFGVIIKQHCIKQQPGYLSWTSAGLLSGSSDFKTGLEIVLLHLSTDDHGVVGWWLWTLLSSSFFVINLKGVWKTHTVLHKEYGT